VRKGTLQIIKGFRDFLMRGNIVDLAIAVVVGTAFTSVVNTFVSAIIKPLISAFPGGSVNGWGFHLRGGKLEKSTFVDVASIVNALIVFTITAAVVYFLLVVPMTRLQKLRARGVEPEPAAVPEDILLLRQIRDALEGRPAGTGSLNGRAQDQADGPVPHTPAE